MKAKSAILRGSRATLAHLERESKILEVIAASPIRPHLGKHDMAPLWVPRANADYLVVTCPECLRSCSIPDDTAGSELHKGGVLGLRCPDSLPG
jgi:hypothetical protein